VVQLALDRVCAWSGDETASLEALRGQRVLVVTGIGAPDALLGQLRAAGVNAEPMIFADHHAFSRSDVELIGARAVRADRIVCTLKDAVKLGPLWPANSPALWYLSQSVVIETGAASVEALLKRLVQPKPLNAPAPTGPTTDSNG
jgi:tetraacyldisaccharide 4'-kinase